MNDSPEYLTDPQRPPRKRYRLIGIGVVIALIAVSALGWWLVKRNSAAPQGQFGGFGGPGGPGGPGGGGRRGPASTVGIATAEVASIPVTIEALGTVMPTATVTVRPRVSGTITQVLFKEGQMVKVGDPLVIIDPRPYEAARLQAEGNLKRDQASLESARVTLKRYQTLLTQDSIAGQDVDTQAATEKQFEGTVLADQAALDTAKLNVEFTRITSPVKGRTGLRVVDIGNYIAAGDANGVVVVTVIDPIDVEFAIPQDQVPAIGQRVVHDKAQLPVTALDRTRATVLAKGMFSALDNQVNTSTGTVKAKARFDNDAATLFPNQFVNIQLLLSTDNNAIVVPVGAVRTGPSGPFVYVFDAGTSTVKMRNVKTSVSANDRIAVTDGLSAGEQVITEGGDRLTDGARVQTAEQATKAPGSRPPGSAPVRHRPGGQGGSSSGGRDPSQWQGRHTHGDGSGSSSGGRSGYGGGNGSTGQAPGP